MAVPDQVSAPSWNHLSPGHSTSRALIGRTLRRFYRHADSFVTRPLAAIVAAALRTTIGDRPLELNVGNRRYEEPNGASVILNGLLLSPNGDIFGEMLRYDPESNITLVIQSTGPLPELEIREAVRPQGADVVRGMSFFMLRGDHILMIDQDLSFGHVERYLRWLIFTQARVLANDTRLQLIPQVFFDGQNGQLREVDTIKLQPPPAGAEMLPSIAAGTRSLDGEVPETNVFAVLKAANFATTVLDRITNQDGGKVKVTINVEFKGGKTGRSKHIISGSDAVDLLRNVPEEELTVKGPDAQRRRGKLERLIEHVEVEQKLRTLDRKDAWFNLSEVAFKYSREDGPMS